MPQQQRSGSSWRCHLSCRWCRRWVLPDRHTAPPTPSPGGPCSSGDPPCRTGGEERGEEVRKPSSQYSKVASVVGVGFLGFLKLVQLGGVGVGQTCLNVSEAPDLYFFTPRKGSHNYFNKIFLAVLVCSDGRAGNSVSQRRALSCDCRYLRYPIWHPSGAKWNKIIKHYWRFDIFLNFIALFGSTDAATPFHLLLREEWFGNAIKSHFNQSVCISLIYSSISLAITSHTIFTIKEDNTAWHEMP